MFFSLSCNAKDRHNTNVCPQLEIARNVRHGDNLNGDNLNGDNLNKILLDDFRSLSFAPFNDGLQYDVSEFLIAMLEASSAFLNETRY